MTSGTRAGTWARAVAAVALVASVMHTASVAWHASRRPETKVADWSELYDGPPFGQTWQLFGPGVPAVEWNVRARLELPGGGVREVEVSRATLARSLRRPWAPARAWRMEANAAVWVGARPTGGSSAVGCGAQAGEWVHRQLDQIARERDDPHRAGLLGGVARQVLKATPEARSVEVHLVATVSRGAPGCSGSPLPARSSSVFAARWERTQLVPG